MSNVPSNAELEAHTEKTGAVFVNESKLAASIKKVDFMVHPGSQLTICVVTLLNGYTVTGESACADPKMFVKETGEKFAFAAAERKIWPLLGYALKQELYLKSEGSTFIDRMMDEYNQLIDRGGKLDAFINGNELFARLSSEEQSRQIQQLHHMQMYANILKERIIAAKA